MTQLSVKCVRHNIDESSELSLWQTMHFHIMTGSQCMPLSTIDISWLKFLWINSPCYFWREDHTIRIWRSRGGWSPAQCNPMMREQIIDMIILGKYMLGNYILGKPISLSNICWGIIFWVNLYQMDMNILGNCIKQ